jgi:hypothetical protein
MKSINLLILIIATPVLFAQTQPEHKKKTYVDSLGRYYQQATLPVYIFIANSPDGKTTPLLTATKKEVILEGHGPHAIKHENHVTMKDDEFTIYADGLAPITNSSFLDAPRFTSAKQYYGPGLKVAVAAKDEMSGVEAVFHSTNGANFSPYQPVSFSTEGEVTYSYYALDRTGNAEKTNTRNFVVDLTAPESFHHIIGISTESVISTSSSIYLTITDNLSGVAKTVYRFDGEAFKPYPGNESKIPFQYLPDGEHTLTYYSVDQVTNKETEKSVKFYLDKTSPIMSADVLGDKFIVGDKVYFSGRTKLKLTAVDNKSGVKEMMYSINNEPFGPYTDPFYLPGKTGYHTVKFYAMDNTSNKVDDDFHHSVGVIYVDLTGPTIAQGFVGSTFIRADTVFASPRTKVALTASDPEAGLQKIAYSLNDAALETTYAAGKPIDLTNVVGLQKLDYFAYDNVNNKNSKSTFFIVDTKGPAIAYQFGVAPNNDKYPSYTSIFLSATDAEVGTDQIKYSINGAKEQPYVSQIKGFAKNKSYTIQVTATDMLGNVSTSEIKFRTDRY